VAGHRGHCRGPVVLARRAPRGSFAATRQLNVLIKPNGLDATSSTPYFADPNLCHAVVQHESAHACAHCVSYVSDKGQFAQLCAFMPLIVIFFDFIRLWCHSSSADGNLRSIHYGARPFRRPTHEHPLNDGS
jgi:hypothetical protein